MASGNLVFEFPCWRFPHLGGFLCSISETHNALLSKTPSMDFGVYLRSGVTYEGILSIAQTADNLGYYGGFINDHVHGFANDGKEPYLEAWTVMTGIGVQTKRLRIGHVVLFNSLRNPAYLAKSISTLDNMIQGRYEVMLGAGWNESEYLGYDIMGNGRGMPSAKERVDRFKETLEILRGMFTHEVFSYDGKYWKLKNAINIPQPIQNPMRISVGGQKPRMVRLAATLADGLNVPGSLDKLESTLDLLLPNLEKAGKKMADYYYSGFGGIYYAKNEEDYEKQVAKVAETQKKSVQEVRKNLFIGTSEILVEKLRRASDLGVKLLVFAPRPARSVEETNELLATLRDEVFSQL